MYLSLFSETRCTMYYVKSWVLIYPVQGGCLGMTLFWIYEFLEDDVLCCMLVPSHRTHVTNVVGVWFLIEIYWCCVVYISQPLGTLVWNIFNIQLINKLTLCRGQTFPYVIIVMHWNWKQTCHNYALLYFINKVNVANSAIKYYLQN